MKQDSMIFNLISKSDSDEPFKCVWYTHINIFVRNPIRLIKFFNHGFQKTSICLHIYTTA